MPADPNPNTLEWTVEIVPAHAEKIDSLTGLVNEIFVTMIPGTDVRKVLDSIARVKTAGFRPVPHLAARSFASEQQLRHFCDGLRDHEVEKVLVIAGGLSTAEGPFTNSLKVLQSAALQNAGISTVALAGHPEGNPVDPASTKNLREKLTFLREQGTATEIVTQWSFSSDKVNAYLDEVRAIDPNLPVRIGVPGPASMKTLLKYAKICGVTAVAEVVKKQGLSLGRLLTTSNPSKFVQQVNGTPGFHLYPFGGLEKSAQWLQQALESSKNAA
jgi:methylenetetrahydrofolate reductase (NADPH)